MKKLHSLLIISFIFSISWSQESPDSTRSKKLKAGATVSLNSNGIAYVPAFSLDKPAVIGTLSLVKGRFSYDPQLSYSLELRPWIIDNWFHYKIVDRPAFEFKAGAVISSFFSEYETEGEVIHQAQKYMAVEFISTYRFSRQGSLAFTYLLDRGQDPGTMQGHFFNLQADRSGISIGKKGLLDTRLQVFYIDYNYNNDGLFTAAYISASLRNIPFAIFAQAILPITSNMKPSPEFKWNVGLSYTL